MSVETIEIKSPTRIDLSGGTLDCWPLYLFVGDAVTINAAIDIYTTVRLTPRKDQKITVELKDLYYKNSFLDLQSALSCLDSEMKLIKTHLKFWEPDKGFDLVTVSESPVGGGLGGSSSLTVGLIKAFSQWLSKDLNLNQIVQIASGLEAQVLHKPTGTQDYFPPIAKGMGFIHYSVEGFRYDSIAMDRDFLNQHIILVYTGKSHHSGINNWDVLKGAIEGDPEVLAALRDLKEISGEMFWALQKKNFEQMTQLFEREYKARQRLSPHFISPEITKLFELGKKQGADALKICGAGGGGCVFLWAKPETHEEIKQELANNEFQVMDSKVL